MIYRVIAELLRLAPTKSPQFDFGELSNLAESLDFIGAPGEIRTPDPLVRSQILYPTELRAHVYITGPIIYGIKNYFQDKTFCMRSH